MKKIFTIVLIMSALMFNTFAQNYITLIYNGQALENEAVIDVACNAGEPANVYIGFSNSLDDDAFFKIHKEVVSLLEGATETFCVGGTCYTGTTSQEQYLPQGDVVADDNHDMALHVTYVAHSNGTSTIKYIFRSTEDENETSVTLRFNSGVGINESAPVVNELKVYPNPAVNNVNIAYNVENVGDAQLVIRNLAGVDVYRTVLSAGQGQQSVNVSEFCSGIYFCGVEVDGKMLYTKKLLVK